jgi:hypothetical protein
MSEGWIATPSRTRSVYQVTASTKAGSSRFECAVVVEGLPAGGVGEGAEAVEAGREAGAVDVVAERGDAAQLVGEGLPGVGLVRDLDAGLLEQVEVVVDRRGC